MKVFDSLKTLSGCLYNNSLYNKDILDAAFLRRAREEGVRLPTGGRNVDRENYWGAKVFTPTAGINRNVIYLDLSSLYPNLFRALNTSLDTIVGTREDLESSEWADADCLVGYVDMRPVKRVDKDENWQDFTDPDQFKMVYDPSSQSMKWRDPDGPQLDECYFLRPEVREGFVMEAVQDWIDEKYQYEGEMYEAIKRVTNSLYGYHGFTNSPLYDWRIAEAITIAGRLVIQHTADEAVNYFDDRFDGAVFISHGDSVPSDEPVIVKRSDGTIEPRKIADLADFDDLSVWTEDGFTDVEKVIKKPLQKDLYAVRTKSGVVRVSEDHSLVLRDGTEVTPEEVEVEDELLHSDLGDVSLPDRKRTFTDDQAWLLGLFTADGTCNHYQYEHRYDKFPFGISKDDEELLERASKKFAEEWEFETTINDTRESSGCLKLQSSGNPNGKRKEMVEFLRKNCYTDNGKKRVPPAILNGSVEERQSFIEGYLVGDGFREGTQSEGAQSFSSNSRVLIDGLVLILREMGWRVTINRRENHGKTYHRVRMVSFHRGSSTEVIDVEPIECEDEYVYDLQTANGHFHAGVGSIIVHNTDGVGIAVDPAPTRDSVLDVATSFAGHMNDDCDGYRSFMVETFDVDPDKHFMEVEVESFSPSVFVPAQNPLDPDDDRGVPKRYATWVTWDEGAEDDDVSITGLEATRSDVAWITRTAQEKVLTWLLKEDRQQAKGKTFEYLRDLRADVANADAALNQIAKRGGIGQGLDEYGSETRRPSPIYRGAKYADEFVDGVALGEGSKPMAIYVKDIAFGSSLPSTFQVDTAEDGDPVDCIAVEDASNLPEDVTVDYEKHAMKAIEEPMRPILQTMGWTWTDVLTQTEQTGFGHFERSP